MPAKTKRKPKVQSLPAVLYEPTAKDARAVAAFKARQEQGPANVKLKLLRQGDGVATCVVDYPEQHTGQVHLMTELGVTDTQLCTSLVTDIANLALLRGEQASEPELNELLGVVRGIGPRMLWRPCSPSRCRLCTMPLLPRPEGWQRP